jgi:hypothetical protein
MSWDIYYLRVYKKDFRLGLGAEHIMPQFEIKLSFRDRNTIGSKDIKDKNKIFRCIAIIKNLGKDLTKINEAELIFVNNTLFDSNFV